MTDLDPSIASRLAQAALGHVAREYPNVLVQVLAGPGDLDTPKRLHPAFYGSYDWHSCVHSHWLLASLLRTCPSLPEAADIRAHFDQALTPETVAGELAYLDRPTSGGFERPYGWAWLLMLSAELSRHADDRGRSWSDTLRPLAAAFVSRFRAFLPKADYPVRAGVHSNTAFALSLALEYAVESGDHDLRDLIAQKALGWYGDDRDCQAWEPSGDDFLSSALTEAELMRRVLPAPTYREWFDGFLPHAGDRRPESLFAPARVSDRGDGKIAHLDGLNLSRAWCWRGIARGAGDDAALRLAADGAARVHLDASLPHVTGDYMGEHWLASFALLALMA
jgi:hypothetical protein